MVGFSEIAQLAEMIDRYSTADGINDTRIPGLRCLRFSAPGDAVPTVYQPSVCVIAQGTKEVMVEGEIYRYEPRQYLGISVDLPVVGQITVASPSQPYLCLQIEIDAGEIRDLLAQMSLPRNQDAAAPPADAIRCGASSWPTWIRSF